MHAAVTRPADIRDRASEREIGRILTGARERPADSASFTYTAMQHGIGPLLVRAGVADLLPAACVARLVAEARDQAVLTELRERELKHVLETLHHEGIEALLIKGAHLASTCYPESYLRTRSDTDLLVRASERSRVVRTLASIGYVPQPVQTGPAVLGQTTFDREGAIGAALDVHWRIAQPAIAASLFDFDDLLSRAVRLPRLGPHARGPVAVDALAIACVHQAAHHRGHELLLWAYDLHLLATGFTRNDMAAYVALAERRRMAAVSVSALEAAAAVFPAAVLDELVARLRIVTTEEPSAALLRPLGRMGRIVLDLRALDGFGPRLWLVLGHLLPPPAYMRMTYAPSSAAPVVWLYLRRLWRAGQSRG